MEVPTRCKNEPMPPSMAALNDHSPVLFVLIRLAPNGYPDAYRLRDLLMRMATVSSIFPEDRSYEATLSLKTRAREGLPDGRR